MTKKTPSYQTGWHSTGTLDVLPSIRQVAQRLEANPDVVLHDLHPIPLEGWWSYDAVWSAGGVRIRGRLNIYNQHPKGPEDPEKSTLDPTRYNPETDPIKGFFHAFAEADEPWDPSWPSPLNVFLERKLKPSYSTLEYGGHNPLHRLSVPNLSGLFNTLAELPWLVTVLTHDGLNLADLLSPSDVLGYRMPFISRLPASLYGKVLDVRIMGEETREKVNRILGRYGTHLPEGGVAVLLSGERRKGIPKSDLSFELDRTSMKGGDLTAVTQSLSKMFTTQVMKTDPEAIDELRDNWFLMTDSEKVEHDTVLLGQAAVKIGTLERQNAELLEALEADKDFIRRFKENGEALLERANRAFSERDKAAEEKKKLQKELDRLLCMIRDSDLGAAMAAREAAEDEVEAAEELLDEQSHELVGLRRENSRLRGELARLNSSFTFVPEPRKGDIVPSSWDELLAQTSLGHVVLGDVASEVDKLRRQIQEENWLNRCWEALRALDEYARLKEGRGAEELPHFHAYLIDPTAEYVIPRTRYSGAESKGVMMNGRFAAARTFSVPRQVDPSGKVVMEAHIRIGSGKPPAPRLHFHDDTSGSTGKIYVGHIGPHLPNYQTN